MDSSASSSLTSLPNGVTVKHSFFGTELLQTEYSSGTLAVVFEGNNFVTINQGSDSDSNSIAWNAKYQDGHALETYPFSFEPETSEMLHEAAEMVIDRPRLHNMLKKAHQMFALEGRILDRYYQLQSQVPHLIQEDLDKREVDSVMQAIRSHLGNGWQISSNNIRYLSEAICLCLNKEDPAIETESFLSRRLGRVVHVLFAS
jgi:hypothetical protein